MTGSLILRLEQLERERRPVNPLAAFSDDELTVQLLEACAEIAASDLAPEDRAEAIATAGRIRSDIEGWHAFWKAVGWTGNPPAEADRIRPLIGNGSGETERDKTRHGEMQYRAAAALASIAAMNGGQPQ